MESSNNVSTPDFAIVLFGSPSRIRTCNPRFRFRPALETAPAHKSVRPGKLGSLTLLFSYRITFHHILASP